MTGAFYRYPIQMGIIALLFLMPIKSFAGEFSGTLNGSVTLHLLIGSQLKAVNLGFSIYGTSTYKSVSVEGGINLNVSPFIQRFGIYRNNIAGNLEVFGLAGYGKNNNLLGSNIGLTRSTSFYDYSVKGNSFYGLGFIMNLNKISGELKKFENAQGGILIRLSNAQDSFTINISNDVSGNPFKGTGTDKGNTARVMIKFSSIRDKELIGMGIGLDMFTPEADYSRVPRNKLNNDNGMRIVSYNTEPFGDLFHLNLFVVGFYQSDDLNIDGRIGVDNPKMGAYIQNKLHDSFGLYPRFSWPVTEKGKFYSLFDVNKSFNYEF